MNLFDIIPENLFSILSSKYKKIYIDALFIIRECFKQEMSLSKEQIVIAMESKLEDEVLQISSENEEERIEDNLSSKVYYVLRRLIWAGWLETEIQDNFEEYVILPDYSIEIIDLLYALTTKNNLEYNAYAYMTYASLKTAIDSDNRQLYRAILSSYNNTSKLVSSIKSLHHNLGRYYRKITDIESINSVLAEHFDNYKEYIDKKYHPLKTDDPVDMYKVPIQKMVDQILGQDSLFKELIRQAMNSGDFKEEDTAKSEIITMLNKMQDVYGNIGRQISMVDKRNTDYIRATNRKIGYMLTSDKELKGKLVRILKNSKKEPVLVQMSESLSIYGQRYLDRDSIFIRNSKSDKKQGKPLEIQEVAIDSKEDLNEFGIKIQNSYTLKRIQDYMKNMMSEKPIITTNDITIQNDEEFILFILATINEEKNFYEIEYKDDYIQKGNYQLPNMVIKKKE